MTAMPSPPRPILTSTANPRIKATAALRERRERDRTGLTLVDGAREVRRAIEAGASVTEAFVCEPLLAGADARIALDRLRAEAVTIESVSETVFAKLAFGDRAEGIVAVVRIPSLELGDLTVPANPLIVVIEGIEKPGNVGAVLRSVDGAGADALIGADPGTDLFNPNAIRASAGTCFGVPLAAGSSSAVQAWLRERGLRIVTARVDADRVYTEAALAGGVAIVLGAEADGLSDAWSGPGFEAVRLPMLGMADSLNISVTAAVLLYEARRQRGLPEASSRTL
jgi:RNA methyltransferase, TrmH family